jgi:hypothetical protein
MAKIWLHSLNVEHNHGYNSSEINYLVKLNRQHQITLLEKWNEYFTA